MLLKDKKVAIVGGGPGGLTLARLLEQAGINVRVFERDKDKYARQQGATLDLHDESGLKALEACGLMDGFKKLYRPGADKMRITDGDLNILMDDHLEKPEEDFGNEYFRPEIDRGPLRELMVESLSSDTIVWDSKFVTMENSGEGWLLHFDGKEDYYADLVIAVDGANSRLRNYITNIQPIFSGVCMVEGNIYNAAKNAPKLWALVKGGKLFALHSDKTIILSAKGEGSLSFYTGTNENENWLESCDVNFENRDSVLTWFKNRFSDWSSEWEELFASEEAYYVPRPMYHFPTDQTWETLPNLTMIGDAAHRMPPYAGEGVNMAMLDALELAEALLNPEYSSITAALHTFEKGMQLRAGEVTQMTLESTEMMHSEGAADKLLGFFGE